MSEDQTPFIHPIALDPRRIRHVEFATDPQTFWRVGVRGVTEIRAYEENGEMARVPWLAVYMGEHLLARVPARFVCIVYDEPSPDPQP